MLKRKEKRCFKCGDRRPLSEFYKHPMMADGHLNKCKACTKKDVQSHYVATIEERKTYDRERNKNPERRRAMTRYARKDRLRNPEKYKARTAVGNAIRRGVLVRKGCRICGGRAQAHHADYAKPLEVDWLCVRHHHEEHGHVAKGGR